MNQSLSNHIKFNDPKLATSFERGKVPISTLFEAYFDGSVDFPGDLYEFLDKRHEVVKHTFTADHVRHLITKVIPEIAVHSKAYDEKLVRWHYDRGDEFFTAFLGPRMTYTSAYFENPAESLEVAQDRKFDLVCNKLRLKAGERFLDIGCGWGTLTKTAAAKYGADATGVTISVDQTKWGNRQIAEAGVEDRARVICQDYRDIAPSPRFNKIASLEMVEHVGVKNLPSFFKQIYEMLEDDGIFFLQWTGLRLNTSVEDLVWILFMSKYVFSGADASLPVAPMVAFMEKAGFEVQSVENISPHYRLTIKKWHDNWLSNKDAVVARFGERWFRIWHVFLAWAVVIADQGTAACFQVVANKNKNDYDRNVWVGHGNSLADGALANGSNGKTTNGHGHATSKGSAKGSKSH